MASQNSKEKVLRNAIIAVSDEFQTELIAEIENNGLVNMSKKDYDEIFFWFLSKHGKIGKRSIKDMSNVELSIRLRAPVSKINKLRRDCSLRFEGDLEASYLKYFLERTIRSIDLSVPAVDLRVIIDDLGVKNYIQGILNSKEISNDSSFNKAVLLISVDNLIKLLEFIENSNVDFKYSAKEHVNSLDARKKIAFVKKFSEYLFKKIGNTELDRAISLLI